MERREIFDIREIYVKHGLKSDTNRRVTHKALGGGVVLDLGAYAIQFVLLCYNEYPKSIKATGKINSDNVDMYFEADLMFSGNRMARIVCSGLETYDNQAVIISKKGTVCVSPSIFINTFKLFLFNSLELHLSLQADCKAKFYVQRKEF